MLSKCASFNKIKQNQNYFYSLFTVYCTRKCFAFKITRNKNYSIIAPNIAHITNKISLQVVYLIQFYNAYINNVYINLFNI